MRGTVERAHSERIRSGELRRQSELISQRIVETACRLDYLGFGDSGDTFTLRLARVRPAVTLMRHSLSRWLERRGLGHEEIDDITLACSEACANAVEHPVGADESAFEVEAAHRDREIVIVVRNSGRWRSKPTDAARGRGLKMIRALMNEVVVVQGDCETEIVMRRRLAG